MKLVFNKNNQAEIFFRPVLQNEKSILSLVNKESLVRLDKEKFQGKSGQVFVSHTTEQTIVLIGTGQKTKLSVEDCRIMAGQMVNYLHKYSAKNIGLVAKDWIKVNVLDLGQALAEGLSLASYSFEKYKKKDDSKIKVNIEEVLVELNTNQRNKFRKGWSKGLILAQGTNYARDLVNEPANIMTPTFLAKQALVLGKSNKNISVKVLDKAQVKKLGMNAFLGIDQGSIEPPKFIHLIYKPQKVKDKIALVGKGVTFDAGGLNIKPFEGMRQMKNDMSGAATVLGIFSVISELKPNREVHGIIAACENMPSGTAIKPGDVVKNMQGKSIEIKHTDAEGRVTLADSLAYAQAQGIKKIVDLATLTGAIMYALGTHYAGLFSNDHKLGKELLKEAELSGEKLWLMPLAEEYRELGKSEIADISNISSTRYGGAITAALFLEEFIEAGTIWAHLDIASPAYAETPLNSYTPIGGVGFGVRTILNWLVK